MTPEQPSPENRYLSEHVALMRRSLLHWAGRDLLDPGMPDDEAAHVLYHAPMVVLSHGTQADPILCYANLTALSLFELSWEELVTMPSRLTAELPDREERARMLDRVSTQGYIDDYAGVRISRHGRRFRIGPATVWRLTDARGRNLGQAASFSHWTFLDP